MDILIRGSSAAAHALAWKLAESRHAEHIYCIPGNAGTQNLCEPYAGQNFDHEIVTYDETPVSEEYMAQCAVSDGTRVFFFPMLKIGKPYSFTEPSFTVSDTVGTLPAKRGFYTLEYSREGTLTRLVNGLSGPAACLSLAMLKGDLTALLAKMEVGFPEDFVLEFRDGAAALFCAEGECGARIEGLDRLSGDTGVFINCAERRGDHLQTTGKNALYLCARDKTAELCMKKLEKAAEFVNIL